MAAPIYKKDKPDDKAPTKAVEPKKDDAPKKERDDEGTDTEVEERGSQEEAAKTPHERHLTERQEMFGRHDSESRDHHNNHRESVKLMHSRQQKERRDMDARHLAELSDQGAGEVSGQQAEPAKEPVGAAPADKGGEA
jgi:hypothetical protein